VACSSATAEGALGLIAVADSFWVKKSLTLTPAEHHLGGPRQLQPHGERGEHRPFNIRGQVRGDWCGPHHRWVSVGGPLNDDLTCWNIYK
jgi:hypothetical protein